jgi:serine/threonine protein phosphatase PrpC
MRIGRFATVSDTGRRRLHNEDASVSSPPLFAIADGMGGAQAGEVASRLAASALAEHGDSTGEEAVVHLVQAANARVYRHAAEDPLAAGMGTTTTVVLVDELGGTLAIGHVGDSRAYRIRNAALEQLTRDHSLVQELVDSGRLTPDEAIGHPHRSVITRAVGTEPSVDVDTFTVEVAPGDLYLLCSDGLTDMVGDDAILAIAQAAGYAPEQVARALVDAANRAGGEDNITVVAFEIEEGEPAPRPTETTAVHDAASTPLAEPDETTMESVTTDGEPAQVAGIRRHGAGPGGRALALAAIVLALAAAAVLIYWGLGR